MPRRPGLELRRVLRGLNYVRLLGSGGIDSSSFSIVILHVMNNIILWFSEGKKSQAITVSVNAVGKLKQHGYLEEGRYVKLLRAPFRGQLARVVSVIGKPDAAGICRSYMLQPSLHRYALGQRQTHCWHIVFLMALTLCCQAASSSCERIGSLLHCLDAAETGLGAGRVAARLKLKVAQVECIGGQRDEALVKSVAETLIEAGKNPIIQKMQKYRRCQKGKPETGNLSVTARVRLSDAKADLSCLTWATLSSLEEEDGVTMDRLLHLYKHREDEKQLYRELHAPKDLDSATRLALDKVVTQRKDGLRIDSLSGHVVRKTLPRSSMREKLADWMASPEGQAWKAQRDAL